MSTNFFCRAPPPPLLRSRCRTPASMFFKNQDYYPSRAKKIACIFWVEIESPTSPEGLRGGRVEGILQLFSPSRRNYIRRGVHPACEANGKSAIRALMTSRGPRQLIRPDGMCLPGAGRTASRRGIRGGRRGVKTDRERAEGSRDGSGLLSSFGKKKKTVGFSPSGTAAAAAGITTSLRKRNLLDCSTDCERCIRMLRCVSLQQSICHRLGGGLGGR